MKTTRLGADGPEVSRLGVGCSRMSAPPRDDAESIATLHALLDAGVNFLDTADFYGMGHNESLIGRAIKDRRDQAFLSVKCGMMLSPTGAFLGLDGRPSAVKNFCAYSLQRLGVDVIDLYQPGRPDPAVPYEETVGAVADLIKEGKVRYLGVSEVGADNLRRANSVHPVAALEIEYSSSLSLYRRRNPGGRPGPRPGCGGLSHLGRRVAERGGHGTADHGADSPSDPAPPQGRKPEA